MKESRKRSSSRKSASVRDASPSNEKPAMVPEKPEGVSTSPRKLPTNRPKEYRSPQNSESPRKPPKRPHALVEPVAKRSFEKFHMDKFGRPLPLAGKGMERVRTKMQNSVATPSQMEAVFE